MTCFVVRHNAAFFLGHDLVALQTTHNAIRGLFKVVHRNRLSFASSSHNGSLSGSLNGNLAERQGGTRTAWQSPRSGRVVNEQKNSPGRGPEPEPTSVNATIRLRPASTPLPSTRGLGDDEDLKGVTLLFASEAGKHITGQILAVDGGVSALLAMLWK